MDDKILKRVEEEQRTSEKILRYLPGYKEKKIRRETDRIVRSRVVSIIESSKKKLDSAFRDASGERVDDRARRIDRLIMKLLGLAEKIRHAPHGYAGIFDAIKAREEELNNLVNFDASLIELFTKIDETCQSALLAVERRNFDDLDKALDQMDEYTWRMEEILLRREETFLGIGNR
ncbi:MAG: hypothetical protein ACUVTL_05355 [Thermoproteota archaeon]